MGETSANILVFGGSGFIGTHMTRKLVTEGHAVISVDIKPPREKLAGVTYVRADVRDLSSFDPGVRIDKIYNFAAIHTTPGHPDPEYYDTNIAGATQITAFARRFGVMILIFTSSISVYGPGEDTKSEATPVAPQSPYGWSKWLAEGIHRAWLEEDSARRLLIMRPAVIFGPGERGNFTRLAKLMRSGFFVYPGRKDTIKACFYVGDLLDAIAFAESREQRYVLFNACYPDRYTLEQIIETLKTGHFQKAKTFMVPAFAVLGAAKLLSLTSAFGLGIHPDRVLKLIRSTDVVPSWLEAQGHAPSGKLQSAFAKWEAATGGRFN